MGKAYILPLMFAVALDPVAAQGVLQVSHSSSSSSSSSTLAGSTLWEQAQARSAEMCLADLLDPRLRV